MSLIVNESKYFVVVEPKHRFVKMRNTRVLDVQQSTANFFVLQSFLSLPLFAEEQLINTGSVSRHTRDIQFLLGEW